MSNAKPSEQTQIPHLFVDGVSSVSILNNVARITLVQGLGNQRSEEVMRLLIPLNRLQPVLQNIADATNALTQRSAEAAGQK